MIDPKVLAWVSDLREVWDRALEKQYPEFDDHAMSVPALAWIVTLLNQCDDGQHVLELGTGFSTMVLRAWEHDYRHSGYVVSADHWPEWMEFVQGELNRGLIWPDSYLLIDEMKEYHAGQYDFIVVDHGPELVTRIADSRWCASLLRPGGCLIFDDWRPRFASHISQALAPLGFDFKSIDEAKRGPNDKALGFGVKVREAVDNPPPLDSLLVARRSPRQRARATRSRKKAR